MKIYTRSGDAGETSLLGGVRVRKSHLSVAVCGGLDETNSLIGLALAHGLPEVVSGILLQVQNDLFDLGSRVAACQSTTSRTAGFPVSRVQALEDAIDHFQARLAELKQFILPGGSISGASLHHCRTVCRRGERDLVALMESAITRDLSVDLVYLNRLGDLLFVLARFVNASENISETPWRVTL
jgi:cob(I)alamin adenosyltransferase